MSQKIAAIFNQICFEGHFVKKSCLFLTKRRAMFSEVIIVANFAAALLQGRVRIPIGG